MVEQELYVLCPISKKDMPFKALGAGVSVGEARCSTPDKLYCQNHECEALQFEPKIPEKRNNLSLREMFGPTFEIIIPEILREMQEDP